MIWLLLVPAYFLGTFPSAVWIARTKGIDITKEGSGNPGASNIARTLGTKWGLLVFLLDALKGALPAALGLITNHRGLGYWTDGKEERVIYVTPGYRMVALDAKTGNPVPGFGRAGIVDLKKKWTIARR